MLLEIRRHGGEERVTFVGEDGRRCSMPAEWTDAAAPDPFVTIARGRSAFRPEDLLQVAELVQRDVEGGQRC